LLFGHADAPLLRPQTLRRIATLGATLRHAIVQPTVRGRPVNPVWFPADLRSALRRVPDTTGGKPVIAAHPERVVHVALDDVAGEFADVDHRRDLDRLGRTPARRRHARG
jgi:CTP:molybdopterin cytidylyltransferase MocA